MVKFLVRGDIWDYGGNWNMMENNHDRSTQNMVRGGVEKCLGAIEHDFRDYKLVSIYSRHRTYLG
jgi:hypothetical protein